VSLAVCATIVIDGDVTVLPSIIVSETVNKANLHSVSEAVAVPAVTNVIVVTVVFVGAVKKARFKRPDEALAPPITPCPRGNQSIALLLACIAQRRFEFTVTLPLNLASLSVPEVTCEAASDRASTPPVAWLAACPETLATKLQA
jgi:hypothetical protein